MVPCDMAMRSPALQNVPPCSELPGSYDVWLQIIAYLTNPKDLSSLSLCCKYFHPLVAPQRWKHVIIDYDKPGRIQDFQALLRTGEVLCQNIRHVDLTGCHFAYSTLRASLLRDLAEYLHPRALRKIRSALQTYTYATR